MAPCRQTVELSIIAIAPRVRLPLPKSAGRGFANHLRLCQLCKPFPSQDGLRLAGAPIVILCGTRDSCGEGSKFAAFGQLLPERADFRMTIVEYPGASHGFNHNVPPESHWDPAAVGHRSHTAWAAQAANDSLIGVVNFLNRALDPEQRKAAAPQLLPPQATASEKMHHCAYRSRSLAKEESDPVAHTHLNSCSTRRRGPRAEQRGPSHLLLEHPTNRSSDTRLVRNDVGLQRLAVRYGRISSGHLDYRRLKRCEPVLGNVRSNHCSH